MLPANPLCYFHSSSYCFEIISSTLGSGSESPWHRQKYRRQPLIFLRIQPAMACFRFLLSRKCRKLLSYSRLLSLFLLSSWNWQNNIFHNPWWIKTTCVWKNVTLTHLPLSFRQSCKSRLSPQKKTSGKIFKCDTFTHFCTLLVQNNSKVNFCPVLITTWNRKKRDEQSIFFHTDKQVWRFMTNLTFCIWVLLSA